MTPFEAYNLYVALRNHFTQKGYDYFKYNGKVKTNFETFRKRKDLWIFQKMAKMSDKQLKEYLIANIVNNEKWWIGDFETGQKTYTAWQSRIQSLSYHFESQIAHTFDIKELIEVKDGVLPKAISLYYMAAWSLETLIIFTEIIGCYAYWEKHLKDDVLWKNVSLLFKKYPPFLNYNKEKYTAIIKKACYA